MRAFACFRTSHFLDSDHATWIARQYIRIFFFLLLTAMVSLQVARGDSNSADWSAPINLSSSSTTKIDNFPRIVSDSGGNVYVLWSHTRRAGAVENGEADAIFVRLRDSANWSDPHDILVSPGRQPAYLTDVRIDACDVIHVVWIGESRRLYYSRAKAIEALNPASWSAPRVLLQPVVEATSAATLMLDADGQTLHLVAAVYDPLGIVHTRSDDGGKAWSTPMSIASPKMGELTLGVDAAQDGAGTLHVVWYDGPQQGGWPGRHAYYASSHTAGATWNPATELDTIESGRYQGNYGPFFPSIIVRADGEIHVVWDGAPSGQRQHIWSLDGGATWTQPQPILSGLRGITSPNRMAVTSDGALHLITGGFFGPTTELFYSVWRDGVWSPLTTPYRTESNEAPVILITGGNTIHVASNYAVSAIWYTSLQTDAPSIAPRLGTCLVRTDNAPRVMPTAGADSREGPAAAADVRDWLPTLSSVNWEQHNAAFPILVGAGVALLFIGLAVVLRVMR